MGASLAQRGGRRSQRPRGGRDGTGYAAPAADTSYAAPDAQPAYGGDQDVYQVRQELLNILPQNLQYLFSPGSCILTSCL